MAGPSLLMVVLSTGFLGMASAQECGRPVVSGRIVGGQDAVNGKWPWQASVQVYQQHICGGTLITNNWVVSAAHCYYRLNFAQSSYRVCMGIYQLSSSNPNSVCSAVKSISYNSLYTGIGKPGDILLLELATAVNFNDFIMPVCLPKSSIEFPAGLDCWVTGWGDIASSTHLSAPKTMQEVMVPLISQSTCDGLYHILSVVSSTTPIILNDMICAGYKDGGKDSCQGDSGGPLVCSDEGGTWFLAGIVSWGTGCALANRPGVYTLVTSYTGWIKGYVTNVTFQQAVFKITSSSTTTTNSRSTSMGKSSGTSIFINSGTNTLCRVFSFFLPFLLLLLLKDF